MDKIKSLSELIKISARLRQNGKTVGLVTGCFDVFYVGHARFLSSAKKHVNVLMVGLEGDESIKLTKGSGRPIFSFKERAELISQVESVDYVFKIPGKARFDSAAADLVHKSLLCKLKPAALIVCQSADKYWRNKKIKAKEAGVGFLPIRVKESSSSTRIIKKLEKEA